MKRTVLFIFLLSNLLFVGCAAHISPSPWATTSSAPSPIFALPSASSTMASPSPSSLPIATPSPTSLPIALAGDIIFQRYMDAHWTGEGDFWTMNADGSALAQFTYGLKGCTDPAFSPDGMMIAFIAIGPPEERLDHGAEFDTDVFVINADGSGLANIAPGPGGHYSPAWSPDGSKIAFEWPRGHSGTDIFVMNPDGSNLTQLTTHPFMDQYPSFSPNGSKIVFVSNRSGSQEIWMMNADGSNQAQLTSNDEEPELVQNPNFSPDGSKIIFQGRRSDSPSFETKHSFEIWMMNADGSDLVQLTPDDRASDEHPIFSPDGSKIMFSCNRFGSSFDICLMNTDGSNLTQLTKGPEDDMCPDWRRPLNP